MKSLVTVLFVLLLFSTDLVLAQGKFNGFGIQAGYSWQNSSIIGVGGNYMFTKAVGTQRKESDGICRYHHTVRSHAIDYNFLIAPTRSSAILGHSAAYQYTYSYDSGFGIQGGCSIINFETGDFRAGLSAGVNVFANIVQLSYSYVLPLSEDIFSPHLVTLSVRLNKNAFAAWFRMK